MTCRQCNTLTVPGLRLPILWTTGKRASYRRRNTSLTSHQNPTSPLSEVCLLAPRSSDERRRLGCTAAVLHHSPHLTILLGLCQRSASWPKDTNTIGEGFVVSLQLYITHITSNCNVSSARALLPGPRNVRAEPKSVLYRHGRPALFLPKYRFRTQWPGQCSSITSSACCRAC